MVGIPQIQSSTQAAPQIIQQIIPQISTDKVLSNLSYFQHPITVSNLADSSGEIPKTFGTSFSNLINQNQMLKSRDQYHWDLRLKDIHHGVTDHLL